MKMNVHPEPEDISVDIALEDSRWETLCESLEIPIEDICREVITVADAFDEPKDIVELSLVLTNDAAIQILNRDYRNKDKPTNVLSFPQIDWENIEDDLAMPFCNIGDVIIAYETIEREAKEQEKSLQNHFIHMLVHGILHLLGYDHIEADEAEEMEKLEISILDKWGIKNPYETIDIMS